MNRTAVAIALAVLAQGLAGCDSNAPTPTAPSPAAAPVPPASSFVQIRTFTDQRSGLSTSNVRDADGQIVQFNTNNELIWTADDTHLPGYRVDGNVIPAESACACWLVVRFGTSNGERRAYLTADYGHDNPGTMVDLGVSGSVLVVKRTSVFVPGTHIQSGVITEVTDRGPVPVADAGVWRLNEERTGWQVARTDQNGFYELRGLDDGSREVSVIKDGYESAKSQVEVNGDTRFDIQLARR